MAENDQNYCPGLSFRYADVNY